MPVADDDDAANSTSLVEKVSVASHNDDDDDDDSVFNDEHLVLEKGPFLDACRVRANTLYIQPLEQQWRYSYQPLLAGVVWAPSRRSHFQQQRQQQQQQDGNSTATVNDDDNSTKKQDPNVWTITFSLAHIKWYARESNHGQWVQPGAWLCDGQEAYVLGGGCLANESVTIQCPQPQRIDSVTIYNLTYRVGAHVDCERNHPLRQPAPGTNLVGSVLVFRHKAAHAAQILDWIEYHRMIGYQHFLVYLIHNYPDQVDPLLFPNLPYVTYIPYNVLTDEDFGQENAIYTYQPGIQVDALHRARAAGVQWLAYNDADEYVQQLGLNSSSSRTRLDFSSLIDKDPTMGDLSLATWSFGNEKGVTKRRRHEMCYVWRSVESFAKARRKSIVRTAHVDYYSIHQVTLGTHTVMADPRALRINHYKRPHHGPFVRHLQNMTTVKDTSLPDMYLTRLRNRLSLIRRLSAEMAASMSTTS